MDLKIKYRTGRAVRNKIVSGTGTKDKYENKYEVSVVTESGTMSQSEWENAIEKRIVELKEEHIVESLIEYALEECAWIHTREGARNYALDLYASRIWENENWVGCKDFRKKIGLDVVEEKEVNSMEIINIELVDVIHETKNTHIKKNDIIEICTISFDNLTRIKTLTLKEEEKHITKEESVKEQKIINKVKISKSTDRLVEVDDIKLYKIKENVGNLTKNTKQFDENVVKLNKENTLNERGG